jgi:hypothetical protein
MIDASGAATAQPVPSRTSRPRLLLANAANALRMTFFLRVADERFPVAWWQVIVFAGVTLLIPALFDLGHTRLQGEINWDAFASATMHLTLALVATIAGAYALNQATRIPRLLLACMMIAATVDVIIYGSLIPVYTLKLPIGEAVYQAYQYVPPAWWVIAFVIYASRGIAAPLHRGLLAGLIVALCLAAPLISLDRNRSLWMAARDKPETDRQRIYSASEDVLNAQPALLAKALDAIQPGRPGQAEFFFVGVAGYGPQDVFRKEVDEVEKLFRDRFGTAGRAIKLINNFGTPLSAPFANTTHLRAALARVAERMNKDEDVLVLFLTSHGSESHEFSLDLWPLRFNRLDPAALRALLDESGIAQRVVIVSACYSGGFVNALRGANTLVIAASAPDRNSFGCSNEADWTYFGKAYFDEALRHSYDFTEAFEKSLPVIAEREKKEDYKPSNPQMALGEDIAPRLAAMARAFRETDARKSSSSSAAAPDAQLPSSR